MNETKIPSSKRVSRRAVEVVCDDGDSWVTEITGTESKICDYFVNQEFEKSDETTHVAVSVRFL